MGIKCFTHILLGQWLHAVVVSSWSSHAQYEELMSDKNARHIPSEGPLIIDTDAGVDDATAIILLLKYTGFEVKAITCVRGSTSVFYVAMNVQKVLNVVDRPDVPIYVGAEFGLVHTVPTTGLFGNDGFADFEETSLKMKNLDKGHAAVAMAKLVTENPGKVQILCLGPLTNLALACHIQPQFLRLAKSVFIFGGTFGITAVTPQVESNFYMDPEAAQFVFKRANALNCQLVMLPMDVATTLSFEKHIRKSVLGLMKSPEMVFLNKLYDRLDLIASMKNKYHPHDKMITGDFYAPAIMINPMAVREVVPYYVEVDTHGNKSRSVTIIDFANLTQQPPNTFVIYTADHIALDKTILFYLQ